MIVVILKKFSWFDFYLFVDQEDATHRRCREEQKPGI
jgi:hypothetical protein